MPKEPAPFTPAAITFLRQLKRNNRREWFQPRKGQFEELLRQPLLALIEQVADDLRSFAVGHVLPAAKAARRIYRDTRFSKDKTPYKTGVSALFPRAGLGKDTGAVYYFGVSPDGVRLAAGLYNPGPVERTAVRTDIDRDPAGFRRLVTAPPLARTFGACQGEQLLRVPKAFPADHPAADLLRHKQWYFTTLLDVATATRPGLRTAIVDHFRVVAPVVDHLNTVLLAAARQADGEDTRPVRPAPMF